MASGVKILGERLQEDAAELMPLFTSSMFQQSKQS
jgi:hypothetical protein